MEENNKEQGNQEIQKEEKIFSLLKELADAQKSLALAKGAQAQAIAKKTVEDMKKNVENYIESASNGYTGRKNEVEHVKSEYKEISEMFAKQYKEDMDVHNVQRQELESELTQDRTRLAIAQKEKKRIEQEPTVQKYNNVVKSFKNSIALASKQGDFVAVEAKMEELKYYQADFAKSKAGQELAKNEQELADLKQKIKEGKEAIETIKAAEMETKKQYKEDKKLISGERSTDLAKIEKQGKLKSLIGKIVAKFSGEKGFNKRVLEPIKNKLSDVKNKMPEIKQSMKTRQENTIKTVSGITHKGKENVDQVLTNLKNKVRSGIKFVTEKISNAKNKVISNARESIKGKIEKTNEKLQQYNPKEIEDSNESR